VAPQVVRVVRDLDLGVVDGRIRPTDPEVVQQLADRRGLGGSLARAASALRARA
jgi:hypothetical protein